MKAEGEEASLAFFPPVDHRTRAIPPEEARVSVLPVHRAGHHLRCHEEDGAGRPLCKYCSATARRAPSLPWSQHAPEGQAVPGVIVAMRIRSISSAATPARSKATRAASKARSDVA